MMLQIKNMESNCCIRVVENELSKLGIPFKTVELGMVEIKENVTTENLKLIDIVLRNAGLEIITDSKTILVEKIKKAIHQLIYLSDDLPKQIFSDFISKKVNHDYTYLSFLFTNITGVNIEKHTITEKIGRVKELLVYNQLSLNEIAFKLKYSSVAHLSNQFKKETGLTLTSYRQLGKSRIKKTGCQ
ncbi:MAG: AraC family transcriptional regulator [Ignavibacteriales bacterium]|nr:MAG: AraC family transcriptional regulator [Ignavibacteriales bacterium]RPI76477.1 MAG: AraC family transcriptional regulator [Ignavibacteriales bacterium]